MTEQGTPGSQSLTVSAPGKLVLWGEYAVLVGAQAGVLAVDRFARCQATTSASNPTWQITTDGFASKPISVPASWFAGEQAPPVSHPGALLWHAAQANQWLPQIGATLHIDSSAFYQGQVKLGLGSSAAVCTALTHLCAELSAATSSPTTNLRTFPVALTAHRAAQHGAGSGIDVAASSLGGLQVYQLLDAQHQPANATQPLINTVDWPQGLYWRAFWTGSPASTTNHLKRFDAWRARSNTIALADLVAASNDCSEQLDLTTLGQYVSALRRFDSASQVGIYAKGHEDLHKLAGRVGVIYKPCGAGGGDLGVAFAADPAQLQRFAAQTEADNITQIRLEMAQHGVTTQAGNHQPNP